MLKRGKVRFLTEKYGEIFEGTRNVPSLLLVSFSLFLFSTSSFQNKSMFASSTEKSSTAMFRDGVQSELFRI